VFAPPRPAPAPIAECFLPHLPEILAGLFDSVIVTFAHGVLRSYALRAEALASTVHIASTGCWLATDDDRRGLRPGLLAMWREDVGVTEAVVILRDLVERAAAAAPAGAGA
jgi:hypothetical protein